MSAAQHTPGPWQVKSWPCEDGRIRYYAARCKNSNSPPYLEWMKGLDGKVIRFESLRKCRAAISKATGATS